MKKIILILITIILACGAKAQEDKRNVLKYSGFHVFDGTLLLSYERYEKERNSSMSIGAGLVSGYGHNGFLIEPQLKKYFYNEKISLSESDDIEMAGGYFSFFLQYRNQKYQYYEDVPSLPGLHRYQTEQITSVYGGTLIGMTFQFLDAISLDIYAGGGIKKSAIKPERTRQDVPLIRFLDPGYNGVLPRLGFTLGILF